MVILRLLILVFLISPPLAHAQSDEGGLQSTIETLLTLRHPDPGQNPWSKLPPDASKIIQRMITQSDSVPDQIRLTEGLAFFTDSSTEDFLKAQALKTDNTFLRGSALESLATSQGEKELGFLKQFLDHSDSRARLAAAQSLKKFASGEAKDAIAQYRSREKDAVNLQKFDAPQAPRSTPSTDAPIRLKPVSTSEDAKTLNDKYGGSFSGFVVVLSGAGEELVSQKALVTLGTGKEVSSLVLGGKKFILREIHGVGFKARGIWLDGSREFPFESTLGFSGRSTLLRMEIPSLKAILVLKRQ